MLLIPFPFLTATVLIVLLLVNRTGSQAARRSVSFIDVFFALAALQSVMLGLRYGYNIHWLAPILPISAVILPPLVLAIFDRPAVRPGLLWHLLPAAVAFLVLMIFPPLLDVIVPLTFVGYALVLAKRGLGPESSLPWARLGNILGSRIALWAMVASLLLSALTDVIIAVDFYRTGGQNAAGVLTGSQGIVMVILCILLWRMVPSDTASSTQMTDQQTGDREHNESTHTEDFAIASDILDTQTLYLDPDLNLQRLARKTGIPAKRLSAAVNTVHGANVSQWINGKRIDHAKQLLRDPEQLVSDVIYACGFNTKSSFNREFKRITSKAPSEWRQAQP